MFKNKEQMAALLINHYYVVKKAIDIGRKKNKPSAKKNAELSSVDWDNSTEAGKVLSSYAKFNAREFIENARFALNKKVADNTSIRIDWAPKILLRGLDGAIICSGVPFAEADIIAKSLTSSRQNQAFLAAIHGSGNMAVAGNGEGGMNLRLLSYAQTPYCNLHAEETKTLDSLLPKVNLCKTVAYIYANITPEQKNEIVRGMAVVLVELEESTDFKITKISVEETDAARAQRLQREALEELKRRRAVQIQQITETQNTLTYMLNGIVQPDERTQVDLQLENLTGEW